MTSTAELPRTGLKPHRAPAQPIAQTATAIAVLAGIIFRWLQLGTKSLWFDEGYTAWVVSHPVRQIVRLIRADTAPPGYYILLHGWVRIFGSSESGLRSMSALASTLALILFWRVAVRVLVRPAAVAVATSVFAFGYMQVGYAHECRFYALMSLVGLLDFHLVLRACQGPSVTRLAALAVCWSITLYLNNVMAIYLAFLGLAWLLLPGARPVRQRIVDAAIVTLIAAAAFAPWLPSLLAQSKALQGNFWPDQPLAWVVARAITTFAGIDERSFDRPNLPGFWRIGGLLDSLKQEATYAWVILPLIAVGIVLAIFRTASQKLAAGLIVIAAGPVLAVYAYSLIRQPIFMDRAFMGGSFAVPLLVGLPWIIGKPRTKPGGSARPPSTGPGRASSPESAEGSSLLDRQQIHAVAAGIRWVWLVLLTILIAPSLWSQRLSEHDEDWRTLCAVSRPIPGRRQLTVFVANEGEIIYDYYSRAGDYSTTPGQTGAPADYFDADPPHTMVRVRTDADLDPLRRRLERNDFDQVVLVASHRWFADHDDRTLKLLQSRFGGPVEKWTPPGILAMYRFK